MQENQLLDVLTREGVLMNVSVRYWRATKKLNAEDLGLDPDKVTDRLISLGHKKLLPKEALEGFALVESRAHALVEASTFPFLKGLSRFLPNPKLPEVLDKINRLAGEFARAKADFLARYAEMRQQASAEWLAAARQLVSDPERLVAAIEASFPEPARMEKFFEFSTQLFQIRVPEGLDLALVSAGEQQEIIRVREQAAQAAASQIHREVEAFVADCVGSLRAQTAQLCEEMLESMRSGKTGLHQKTLNRLVRFIDEFKQLNFAGDRQMEAELERVRQEFLQRTAADYRDSESARARLQAGLRGLADTARDLARQDCRQIVEQFGALGQRKFHLAA
ncbi:MAG: hypothetical protein HY298_20915 [Verrucomicrobia bacterium]|nr:hypothetical protein [Verrucomicrobiota bacterium]